ncbi:MAG TPA: hypothetical protein DCR77_03570 [Flavobacteriaceae bacterium]|nr:hypothetical protein [Flavobacteriaceae bacterium]
MLSIIISSYQDDYLQQFKTNVEATIGNDFVYEIVTVQNNNKYSINEAYNKGARIAKYNNLLFIHEDVVFSTNGWGDKLVALLSKENVGCIGVAGEDYESYFPSYWFSNPNKKCHFIQDSENGEILMEKVNFKNELLDPIVSLDGVFIACTRKVFDEFLFDEKLKGYHGYDYDFSVRVASKYQNYISSEILIKHFSKGGLSKEWLKSLLYVREKNGFLSTDQSIDKELELFKAYNLILLLKKYNYTTTQIFLIIRNYLSISKIGFFNCLKIINRLRYT